MVLARLEMPQPPLHLLTSRHPNPPSHGLSRCASGAITDGPTRLDTATRTRVQARQPPRSSPVLFCFVLCCSNSNSAGSLRSDSSRLGTFVYLVEVTPPPPPTPPSFPPPCSMQPPHPGSPRTSPHVANLFLPCFLPHFQPFFSPHFSRSATTCRCKQASPYTPASPATPWGSSHAPPPAAPPSKRGTKKRPENTKPPPSRRFFSPNRRLFC